MTGPPREAPRIPSRRAAPARSRLSPRKEPAQRRSRETVRALLEAAAQVLEREGLDGATTDRIAARAGVSVGSLYQYFPGKEAIVLALAREHARETGRALAPVVAGWEEAAARPGGVRVDELVEPLVGALAAVHRVRPGLHRVLFDEAPRTPALRRALERGRADLAAALARALAACRAAAPRDPDLAAAVAIEAADALVHRLLVRPPAGRDAAACEAEIRLLLRRYLAPAARRGG